MSRPPIPILYAHHRPELGGAPASLAQMIARLDRATVEPHVYCPPGPVVELFRDAGATVHTGPVAGLTHIWASTYSGRRWLLLLRELARLPVHVHHFVRTLESRPFGLVHLNDSPLIPAALLARRRGLPVVWHLRSALPPGGGLRSRLVRTAIGRLATTTIAINEDVAASFSVGSEVLPNGVDLRRFRPGEPGPRLDALGLPADVPAIGYFGFVYPSKGFREFLQAAALLRERRIDARYLIVGGAVRSESFFQTPAGRALQLAGLARDYDREARDLVAELAVGDVVRFVPFTRDPAPLYGACSIVVSPSGGPELGRPVLEAAASGIPVIASGSRTGGGIIEPDKTALLVESNAPERLADAIEALLGDPERLARMGAAARSWAEGHFDIDDNTRRLERIYARILAGPPGAEPVEPIASGGVPRA